MLPFFSSAHRPRLLSILAITLLTGCELPPPEDSPEDEEPTEPDIPAASACESFTPCGGNLLGGWRVRAACVGAAPDLAVCDGYASNRTVSGTAIYDFGSDGILRYEGSFSLSFDISASEACAQAVARKDAAGYCKLLADSSDDNPRVPSSITCSVADASCSCHVEQGPISGGNDSSFALASNSVTILADGVPTVYGYCVSDNTLTLGTLVGQPTVVFARR